MPLELSHGRAVVMLPDLIDALESSGLVYFDDFFELSGNWPDWLTLYARGAKGRGT
jgi:hypothetical protein